MKLLYVTALILSGYTAASQHSIPNQLLHSSEPVFIQRDADLEYLASPDSLGNRITLRPPDLNGSGTKLPYPIILIHGLSSSSETWKVFSDYLDKQYAFTFGGRLDFCLNFDRNNVTSNTLSGTLPGGAEDMAAFGSTLVPGDYYYLNFDVGYNGSFHPQGNAYDVLSNQSAITKQGIAVKWAIQEVLKITGRDKVILVGHSMGGLASREYLQNQANWQADGKHHVAKLLTTGTPHGGSNTTGYGLGIGGINEQSEAVRDLRSSYYYSKDKGIYLWGGPELQNATHMNDGYGFFNVDVNANGIANETIVGLNQKSMAADIDYSCIIGKCSGCLITTETGDGIVSSVNADLKNIYPSTPINQFYYSAYAATEIHTALPDQAYQNMQGLDEPNAFNLSYGVNLNTFYTGFTTVQATGVTALDDDNYLFKIEKQGTLSVKVNKTDLTDLTVDIYDATYNKIGPTVHSNGSAVINVNRAVAPGDYYLVISNKPTATNYQHPYNFILNHDISTGIAENTKNENAGIYPNPVSNLLNIRLERVNPEDSFLEVRDVTGREVMKMPYSTSIDVSILSKGIYFLKIKTSDQWIEQKFIKE